MTTLFTITIPSTNGTITCTSPSPNIYLLTFTSSPDNRITTSFLRAFSTALSVLERRYPPGVLVTTSGIPKFYSNGFDLAHTLATQDFFAASLIPLLRKLLIFPMPTVALVNGHAFGAGCFLALAHDYRVQNPSRGFLCLNEVDLGLIIPASIAGMIRHRLGTPTLYRSAVLEGKRFGGKESLESGFVDALGGWEDVAKLVEERALVKKAQIGALAGLKEDAYREILDILDRHEENEKWRERMDKERTEARERVEREVAALDEKSKL